MIAKKPNPIRGLFLASGSAGRFARIGAIVILAIFCGAAALIWMQRNEAIANYRIATTNLSNGMSQQTFHAVGAVNSVLREIQARLASERGEANGGAKTVGGIDADHDEIGDPAKVIAGVNALAIVDRDETIRTLSGAFSIVDRDDARQEFFTHFKIGG